MALISIDSKFMKFVDRAVDVFVLNLVWLVFCLPLVTIGAATAAAFAVTMKMVDDEEGPVVRSFWKAFLAHFRRGTALWLLQAAALYALYLDFQLLSATEDPPLVLLVISIVSVVFVFGAFVYAYALTVRYGQSVKAALQNSVRICFQYYGRTLLLIAVLGVELAVFAWNTPMLFFGLAVGPMVLLYTISGVGKRIFQTIDQQTQAV